MARSIAATSGPVASAATVVDAGRARLMRGLTDDDYLRTVTVLDRMTADLTPGR